ncbi:DUF4139 domain-containing protein [Prevotella sp. P6B4]|uniref:DUF4139 domain-containing protein n=1 Tax=Prevotella sp. P6B4 TaxID=1410614 RepID=UPI00048DD2FD|nr:DUF4139 domain-containing protein [Prevotella sp. P6B4]
MNIKRKMLIALCLMVAVMTKAVEKQTASINKVTVFTNGAQVERSKSVILVPGEQVVTFTGFSPYMDRKSLQVKAKGHLTILGISERTAHPDSVAQVKKLRAAEDDVKAVEHRIQQTKDEQEMLTAQLELVKINCSVAGRTVATPLANIKELNAYYAQQVLSVKKRSQELEEQLQKLNDELKRKQDTCDSIAKQKLKSVTEIDVKVDAKQTGRADFDITYYVKNAGWFPSYDVRSNSTKEPLQLSYKANIYQNTKEEWKNVPVTLSSSNPNRSNVAPQLKTYWLDYGLSAPSYNTENDGSNVVSGKIVAAGDGDPLIGASVIVKGTNLGTVSDIDGNYSIVLPQNSSKLMFSYVGYVSQTHTVEPGSTLNIRLKEDQASLQEVVVVGYGVSKKGHKSKSNGEILKAKESIPVVRGVAVEEELNESEVIAVNQQQAQFGYEFDIKQLLTLPDGGKTTTTEIARHQLPASYEYRGIPKIDKESFLVADATDWQKLNLMEGEANVFFDNSFVGKSILDPNVSSDTLHFSMGRDQSIRVQRTKVSESSTRRFFGSNQEQTLKWRITVKNNRQESVNITVFDQAPISRNTSIEVIMEELSDGQYDKKTGIIKWPLQLQPGEHRDLILQYKVKYPKNRRLNIE